MVAKVLDMWDALLDSKFGVGILMVAILAVLGIFGGAMLTSMKGEINDYTGTAVIQSHEMAGSFCYVNVKAENGYTGKMIYGPKTTCFTAQDGTTLNIVKGSIKN